MILFYIGIGGALGAIIRYLIGINLVFPFGTLFVNVLGSFIMGIFYVYFLDKGFDRWVGFLMVGLLGGFTTFSTFSLDTLRLIEMGRFIPALLYIFMSVFLSVLALFIAVLIARSFAS